MTTKTRHILRKRKSKQLWWDVAKPPTKSVAYTLDLCVVLLFSVVCGKCCTFKVISGQKLKKKLNMPHKLCPPGLMKIIATPLKKRRNLWVSQANQPTNQASRQSAIVIFTMIRSGGSGLKMTTDFFSMVCKRLKINR